ncbi:MAG: aryl-sulfate sulfotransferase [Bacteroidota bacterium]
MRSSFCTTACCVVLLSCALMMQAQDAGIQFQYLHPLPGSSLVSKQTTIIVRPGEHLLSTEQELASLFTLRGSISGIHNGRTIISDDRKTIIWRPSNEFFPSETVFVRIQEGMKTTSLQPCPPLDFYFVISPNSDDYKMELAQFLNNEHMKEELRSSALSRVTEQNAAGVSTPSDFPAVKINVSKSPDSGYLYMTNMWNGSPYLLLFDNAGLPVFYRKVAGNAYDFKVQPTGRFSYYLQSDINRFYIMDSTYTVIDSIVSVHGYTPNEHELRILPNGHMLLIGSEVQSIDMSKIVAGGNPHAMVLGNHILELDAAKNVVFEWRCWDHFKITDCIDADLTSASFDYVHMNAIDIDADGNLLISNRNMSEVTKINRKTGGIMWRLGGKNNQFTFTKDPNTFSYLNKTLAFSYQHDIRLTPDGTYTLYDNGDLRTNKFTRAVEYKIDTLTMTAEMVWQYRNVPDFYSGWMGSVQRLPSGKTLIGWADASAPKATEVDKNGTKTFEMDFVSPSVSYRTNRSVWKGKANAPYLIVEPHHEKVTLLFNTFGDSDVVQYNIYGGLSPRPSTLIASTEKTSIDLTTLQNGGQYYFRVTSVDSKGHESKFSNEESAVVKYMLPGDNILLNGNFSQGLSAWQLDNYDSAASKVSVLPNGECFLYITKGGANVWSVQFLQPNLELVFGKKYIFEFDAYASAQRMIDVKVEKNSSPWTNYSRTSTILLPAAKKHFTFPFTMQNPTDYRARVSFNCGISNAYVFLSNVVLYDASPAAVENAVTAVPRFTILRDNFPNPFNPSTTIEYSLAQRSNVTVRIFDLLGRELSVLVNEWQMEGEYTVSWDASGFSSGMYFYTLQTGTHLITKRMLLLK